MSPLDQLNDWLRRTERRLRLGAISRGTALLAVTALVATVLLALIVDRFAFSEPSLTGARLVLFLTLAAGIVAGLVLPLLRTNRRTAAGRAEQSIPEFQQRLLTLAERPEEASRDPFVELLAEDTLHVARRYEPSLIVPRARIAAFCLAALAGAGVLLWLILAGPGFLGHGASLLWAGSPREGDRPFYEILVSPGDQTVRRKSDQLITAYLRGFSHRNVQLHARYHSASHWESVQMQPQPAGNGFEFLLPAVPESIEYYVEAGAVRSQRFNLSVVDLPAVKKIRVTYKYPNWTGLASTVEEDGGDLRAVEGSEALLEIFTDKPVEGGLIVLDNQPAGKFEAAGENVYRAVVPIKQDGLYYLAATEKGHPVRLTGDYFIEARAEMPPAVKFARPARDYKANPIEEVTVAVEAADDYGLHEVSLVYSVNGGPEKKVDLLSRKGATEASGQTVIALEDYNLVPGDLVAMYAVARDARSVTRTDMFFIEAQPFEKEYMQSQQSGGAMGGGQQDENQISQRQKEMIAATWNQIRDRDSTPAQRADAAKFLAEVQGKLRDQARSLARRMQSRELNVQNQEFNSFQKDMNAAAEAMSAAVDQLKNQKWQEALVPEQKALQHLLRAEATFRQIQVAFGARGGGGGMGGAGRDLESLFDLELDTEKNQYETGRQAASQSQQAREIDEALQRLEQLARRQQELASNRQNQQTFQQRWQQEMLRREAEQLQRQMEQLTRGAQQSSQSQQGQGQSSQSASSASAQGRQGQSGRPQSRQQQQQAGLDPRVQQALERLRQATEDMRRAAGSSGSSRQSEAEARRAAERLNEARNLLGGMRRQESADQLSSIAERAENLAQQQREMMREMQKLFGSQGSPAAPLRQPGGVTRQQAEALAEQRNRMSEELSQLERDMQNAVRSLSQSQREAASKLREALSQMQADDLSIRLKYSAEYIRRGMGHLSYLREAPITEGLNRLSEKVRDAQRALGQGQQADRQNRQGLEEALENVERLRRQLEQQLARAGRPGEQSLQQGQPSPQGQQGQGRPGQQGRLAREDQSAGQQGGGDQPGNADGFRQGAPGARESRYGGRDGGADWAAMNRGDYMPDLPATPPQPGSPGSLEGLFRQGLRDLGELRRELKDSPEVQRDIQQLIREMERLDPSRFKGNPALLEQLRASLLANLEQVELQLRRKLEDRQPGQIRSSSAHPIPPGYRDSVAEYFRKLSKGQ